MRASAARKMGRFPSLEWSFVIRIPMLVRKGSVTGSITVNEPARRKLRVRERGKGKVVKIGTVQAA